MASETCRRCKAESATGAGYVKFSGQIYCPACYPKEREESARGAGIMLPVLVAGLLMITFFSKSNGLGWLTLNVFTALLFSGLIILPHELGHALSAHWMGMRVHRVSVGVGPRISKFRFLAGTLEIHRYFVGGYTLPLDRRIEGYRLRHWICTVCGPLVNLLLFLALIPFLPQPFSLKSVVQGWDPRMAFLGANALVLAINMIPWIRPGNLGMGSSDGHKLLSIPFVKLEVIRKLASLYFLVPASEHLGEGRNEEALALYQEGLKEFPESPLLRHELGVALIRLDRVEEAREIYLGLLEAKGLEPQVMPLCLSNIAACNQQIGAPELIPEADRCSAEAMTTMAWHPGVKTNRASVLISLGRFDEGIAMAREALEWQPDDRGRGVTSATLAKGYHAKGDLVEGRKFLDQATRLGCSGRAYRRIRDLYETPLSSQ